MSAVSFTYEGFDILMFYLSDILCHVYKKQKNDLIIHSWEITLLIMVQNECDWLLINWKQACLFLSINAIIVITI